MGYKLRKTYIKKRGLPPGTLIHSGKHKDEKVKVDFFIIAMAFI